MKFQAVGAKAMREPAAAVAKLLQKGTAVLIEGEIGAGKTTLVKAIMKELGWKGKVVSPTFTIASKYEIKDLVVYHLDLYRLNDRQIQTGFLADYFNNDSISIVEWPEKLPEDLLADSTIKVRIDFEAKGKLRIVTVEK